MNHFIPSSAICPISRLIEQREAQLDQKISSLSIADVRDERKFRRLKDKIRRTILVRPIVFGKPVVSAHPSCGAHASIIERIICRILGLFTSVVSYPFTGSKELFNYTPEPSILHKDETGIFEPEGDCVSIDVNLPFQDEDEIIREASIMVKLTAQFLGVNNAIVAAWSMRTEALLEWQLEAKRRELLRLY